MSAISSLLERTGNGSWRSVLVGTVVVTPYLILGLEAPHDSRGASGQMDLVASSSSRVSDGQAGTSSRNAQSRNTALRMSSALQPFGIVKIPALFTISIPLVTINPKKPGFLFDKVRAGIDTVISSIPAGTAHVAFPAPSKEAVAYFFSYPRSRLAVNTVTIALSILLCVYLYSDWSIIVAESHFVEPLRCNYNQLYSITVVLSLYCLDYTIIVSLEISLLYLL